MANYDLIVDLDIEKLINKHYTPKLHEAFDKGLKIGINKFARQIEIKLKENLTKYKLNGLTNQIKISIEGLGIKAEILEGGNYYAMYVEYGTGVVGENFSHPKAAERDWMYDINSHGDSGWWYPSNAEDTNPTKYKSATGWWAWTAGQASRPFMYETWLWARRSFHSVLSSSIEKEIYNELRRMGG